MEILSYKNMCQKEGIRFQQGMTFKPPPQKSVLLMSIRKNSPYPDQYLEDNETIIYQGHNAFGDMDGLMDQPLYRKTGKHTENGKFYCATMAYLRGISDPVKVNLYQKLLPGIWCFNGEHIMRDAWEEIEAGRKVLYFRLDQSSKMVVGKNEKAIGRYIPSKVKALVYKRDKGRCVICNRKENLHFDHIIPMAKGGSSVTAKNIQLLCQKHNLAKRDHII